MQNYKSSNNKNSNKTSEEDYIPGYIPKICDLKCYKCRYQGICVIPKRIIEARKRFIRNNRLGVDLLNNKYRLNDFFRISRYENELLGYLINFKKKKLYNKDSE